MNERIGLLVGLAIGFVLGALLASVLFKSKKVRTEQVAVSILRFEGRGMRIYNLDDLRQLLKEGWKTERMDTLPEKNTDTPDVIYILEREIK